MKKRYIFNLINLYLVISTIITMYYTVSFGTVAGQVDTGVNYGWFYICTFTVQSNLLLGVVAGITLLKSFTKKRKQKYTRSDITLYLTASTATMLTLLTVVSFLAPMRALNGKNYFDMLTGPMFFFHFFNPLVSAISFIFFMSGKKIHLKDAFFALVPLNLYAILYIVNVVVLKAWNDFYGFTFGGNYILTPIVLVVMNIIVFTIAAALILLRNLILRLSKQDHLTNPKTTQK